MASKSVDHEFETIGKRVAAKSCAKNPSVAMESAEQRHQISGLKEDLKKAEKNAVVVSTNLTQRLNVMISRKQRVLMMGDAAVRKLVGYKMAENDGMTEAEALLSVITEISVDAFGAAWSNSDVTEIRQWCLLQGGGSVTGQVRGEVARVTAFMPAVAQALIPTPPVGVVAPVVAVAPVGAVVVNAAPGPEMGEGLGPVGEVTAGVSQGSNRVVVAVDHSSDLGSEYGTDEYGYSSEEVDEGTGLDEGDRPRKRRRVSAGTDGETVGGASEGENTGSSGEGSSVGAQT